MPHATGQRQIASNLRVYKKLKNLSLSLTLSLWGQVQHRQVGLMPGPRPCPKLRQWTSCCCRNVEPGHILIKLGFYMAAALLKSMRIVVVVVVVGVLIVVVAVLIVVVVVTIVVGGLCCYFVHNERCTNTFGI